MLRYQINPHFMYNTLNTISALAEIEGVPGIVQMAGSLSKILYYNVKGKDVVLLRDEIEYMRNYLQIQDIRFPGRFHTKIEVPADVGNCYMLKFLIQPILENSISHGLSVLKSGQNRTERICTSRFMTMAWEWKRRSVRDGTGGCRRAMPRHRLKRTMTTGSA